MTTVLCTNAYKAARKVYRPAKARANTPPILDCIHLYHHEGRLAMTTTNLEKPLTEYISARTDEDSCWETCVPMKSFTDWLRVTQTKTPKHAIGRGESDQITMTLDPTRQILHIKASNTRAEFKCIDAQEFPAC